MSNEHPGIWCITAPEKKWEREGLISTCLATYISPNATGLPISLRSLQQLPERTAVSADHVHANLKIVGKKFIKVMLSSLPPPRVLLRQHAPEMLQYELTSVRAHAFFSRDQDAMIWSQDLKWGAGKI